MIAYRAPPPGGGGGEDSEANLNSLLSKRREARLLSREDSDAQRAALQSTIRPIARTVRFTVRVAPPFGIGPPGARSSEVRAKKRIRRLPLTT